MNFGKLYLGNVFIILGFVYLVKGLGVYNYDFSLNLFYLIPVLVISFGLSLLDLKKTVSILLGTASTLLLVVISVIFLLSGSLYNDNNFFGNNGTFMMNRFFDNSMPCQNILFDRTNGY